MKLFSLGRTDLAVSSKLPTPVAIEKYRGTIIALRTSVMVWFLDGPLDRRFAHSVQISCRRNVAEDYHIFFEQIWKWRRNNMPVRCPYRNHSIPAKKLLQTLLTFSLRSILNCSKDCIRSISKHILCRKIQLPDHPPRFYNPRLDKMTQILYRHNSIEFLLFMEN